MNQKYLCMLLFADTVVLECFFRLLMLAKTIISAKKISHFTDIIYDVIIVTILFLKLFIFT